jgi:hypothetical protein
MAEDTDLAAYILARSEGYLIDKPTMARALALLYDEPAETIYPENAQRLVTSLTVAGILQAPISHDHQAVELLTSFINIKIYGLLVQVAQGLSEDVQEISRAHLLSWCHQLPYPFNVYLC